ncbi:hypothetical protein OG976_19860 [Mycobacterium sp. NBC_00419]|uniref:hypothetical protein n=1 Tax=Mycobacterium sp. NBC_00419 TaxID=2975989 RepID=UPI002E214E7D
MSVRVAADKTVRGDAPPEDYLIQILGGPVNYVGNSPEVIVFLLKDLPGRVPSITENDQVQVGFPGLDRTDVVYVGSWQWDIHGEARGLDFVGRAAGATVAAIEDAQRRPQ